MVNLSELVVDFEVNPHDECPEVLQTISMEVVQPGNSGGRIASLDGFIISRGRCGDGFHSILDEESDELHRFSVALFDKYGKVKSHIVSEGFRSGTRCWGRELNVGKIIYVVDVTVHKDRRQGIGSFVLQKLFESEYVQDEDIVISWPVSRDASNDILVAFFRKNGFRRIGRTNFLGYSPNPNHPSHRILPGNDVESLEDKFPESPSIPSNELIARGLDVINEERWKKYPLHYAIVNKDMPDITTVIQSFYDKDPASIHVPDDRGFLPVFVAARAQNVHALNKLIELGVAEDLNNTNNAEGVTPLESVLDSMQSTREFCEAMLGTWPGNSEKDIKIVRILKTAMELPEDSDGQLPFGCTCGQCSGGWLSPRMRFALQVQAAFYMDTLPMDLSSFTRGEALDASEEMIGCGTTAYLPPALQRNMFKSFYRGFTTIFEVIYKILKNDSQIPKLQDIERDAVFEWGTSFYFSKGGRVEYALDAVTAIAKEQSNLGDGTFYETFGGDEGFVRLPECVNDEEFEMVRVMLGLDPRKCWGPFYLD
ncbi:ankyrin repeat family protein [Desarmillaria tabescens]|uniref:Ankyrin repeat family protein n=1 Tax=Armillaria tabescens TaxID=1929756 RepID=A0AA39JBF6_ARMTA|nr:ankyrin repeat family protein [Desarmillaria tabescens]KAK0439244.1 ankyrin repeat family protein [Desarmillaria tabescens]